MSKDKGPEVVLRGPKDFVYWYDYITTELVRRKLIDYIHEDKIKDIDIENTKSVNEIKELMKNAEARIVILGSITREIHKEVIGIISVYRMVEKIKKKYGGDFTDMGYWVRTLNSLHTEKKVEIMETLNSMKEIFTSMNSKNLKISEDEKLKYVFNALPQDYISKFILTKDDTFDTVYGKIEDDISRKSYIESWQNQNYNDDPMEIDYVKKEHNKNEKNNSKKNNKYCGICDSHSHDLKDCCNHKRNYSNKKGVHLIGKISDYDINDYYNANVGYEDIKTLFFDSDEDENYSNTLNNYKNKKINH
eukprot:jgi/Orpsp1_1/1176570/evm.model.c7180000058122.1